MGGSVVFVVLTFIPEIIGFSRNELSKIGLGFFVLLINSDETDWCDMAIESTENHTWVKNK